MKILKIIPVTKIIAPIAPIKLITFSIVISFLFAVITQSQSQAQVQTQTQIKSQDSGDKGNKVKGNNMQNHPCKEDIKKFCKNVKKGQGGLLKCLKVHEDELSDECKARGEQLVEKKKHITEGKQSLRENCTVDVKKFCTGIKPGKGGIKKCLNDHESELSSACRDTINKIQRR